jgi:hypothetical protein
MHCHINLVTCGMNVTFNKNTLKSIKCWYMLTASSAHCQMCIIPVIYNCMVLIFFAGMYIWSVNVPLCYTSYVCLRFLVVCWLSLLVELLWLWMFSVVGYNEYQYIHETEYRHTNYWQYQYTVNIDWHVSYWNLGVLTNIKPLVHLSYSSPTYPS